MLIGLIVSKRQYERPRSKFQRHHASISKRLLSKSSKVVVTCKASSVRCKVGYIHPEVLICRQVTMHRHASCKVLTNRYTSFKSTKFVRGSLDKSEDPIPSSAMNSLARYHLQPTQIFHSASTFPSNPSSTSNKRIVRCYRKANITDYLDAAARQFKLTPRSRTLYRHFSIVQPHAVSAHAISTPQNAISTFLLREAPPIGICTHDEDGLVARRRGTSILQEGFLRCPPVLLKP